MSLTNIDSELPCLNSESWNDCRIRHGSNFLKLYESFAKKKGAAVEISLTDGSRKTYASEKADVYVMGYDSATNYVILLVSWQEWSTWSVVNRVTGKVTNVLGYPVFSPDRQRLFSSDIDVETDIGYNGFEVYRLKGKDLVREWNAKLGEKSLSWGPKNPRWASSARIELTKVDAAWPNDQLTITESPIAIEYLGGHWEIAPNNSLQARRP